MSALLEVRGLCHDYVVGGRRQTVLRDVDLELEAGQALALVGRSGCGKSTLGRCIAGLLRPRAGLIRFAGQDLTRLSQRALRPLRQRLQLVFQSPRAATDARQTIAAIVAEPLVALHLQAARGAAARVPALLERVGLDAALAERYPGELSGGQLQRVCIARALASEPELLIADEPTSSLDLSAQAQILELLATLRREMGLALLLITHDLRLLPALCDQLVVLDDGAVVERLAVAEFSRAEAAATRELLAAAEDVLLPSTVLRG